MLIIIPVIIGIITFIVSFFWKGAKIAAWVSAAYFLLCLAIGSMSLFQPKVDELVQATKPFWEPVTSIVSSVKWPSFGEVSKTAEKGSKELSDTVKGFIPDGLKKAENGAASGQNKGVNDLFVPLLVNGQESSTKEGSVRYGATLVLEPLDALGRAQGAHILVKDHQEPGQNEEKRAGRLTINPSGWHNFKIGSNWQMDRSHLVGYQFSGLNDEARNLFTGTAFLNRGTNGKGSNQNEIKSMLYYEQQLDSWLSLHPHYTLDYAVKPLYQGRELVPRQVYLQWVGIDEHGQTLPIQIGGKNQVIQGDVYGVVLENQSPDFQLDYATGRQKK